MAYQARYGIGCAVRPAIRLVTACAALIAMPGFAQAAIVLKCDEQYSVPIRLSEQPAVWSKWDSSRGTPEWVDVCANHYRTATRAGCAVVFVPQTATWMHTKPEDRISVDGGPVLVTTTVEIISRRRDGSYLLSSSEITRSERTGQESRSDNEPLGCTKVDDSAEG